jgi:hypothetical protein
MLLATAVGCSKGTVGSPENLLPVVEADGGGTPGTTGGEQPPPISGFTPDAGSTGSTGSSSGQSLPPPHAPVAWAQATSPGHPQTFFDQTKLTALRQARTSAPYATMHAFASAYLDWNASRSDHGAGSDGFYAEVGGYAVLAEIEQKHADVAVSYLSSMCASTWLNDLDLGEATELISASIAYDVLYNEPGFSATEAACKAKIVAAARDLYNGARGGQWWATDYMNNHNWHDNAALGIAGQALRGDATYATEAASWRAQTDADFATVAKAQALISDGTWHEGVAYGEFGLSSQMLYWVSAERAGSTPSDDTAFVRNWAHYILQIQMPNHPRTFTMTDGDWVWPRPTTVAMLKYIAHRFADPLAQEAAARWDLDGRPSSSYTWLGRYDFSMDWALEYVTFDPAVPALAGQVPLPLDSYNDDQGSFVMRSSWNAASGDQGLVVTLKNGYEGGKGNALRMSSCSNAPGAGLNVSHDHEDDFGLYIYGKGGWLLPEASAYNCCGTGTSSDPDAYQDTIWHNSVTFDGVGQLGDNKISAHSDGIMCGASSHPWFFQRTATVPIHVSTAHYAIGSADGLHLYPATLGLTRATRTVVVDRETNAIALTDDFALAAPHVVQQHFHSMKGATSALATPWVYLDNTIASGGTVNPANTALGIDVIAPANVSMAMAVQQSDAYSEWLSPDGAFGHATVSTPAPVSSTRFVELLWPTTTTAWSGRPNAAPLDLAHPENGFLLPLGTGDESFVLNTSGSSTRAGGLELTGALASDLAVVRTDGSKPTRMLLLALSGGKLTDQNGARTLIDLNGSRGVLEVAFDAAGNPDLSGTASLAGVKFYAPSQPAQVTHEGVSLSWTRDGATGLVTLQ